MGRASPEKVDSPQQRIEAAEALIAQLDAAAEEGRPGAWRLTLAQLMVLLTLSAIYFGGTRSFFRGAYSLGPWIDLAGGCLAFVWLLVAVVRGGSHLAAWRAGMRRRQQRREALADLVEAKRMLPRTAPSPDAPDGS